MRGVMDPRPVSILLTIKSLETQQSDVLKPIDICIGADQTYAKEVCLQKLPAILFAFLVSSTALCQAVKNHSQLV